MSCELFATNPIDLCQAKVDEKYARERAYF